MAGEEAGVEVLEEAGDGEVVVEDLEEAGVGDLEQVLVGKKITSKK